MKKMMTVMILKTQKEQTEKLRNLNQRNYGPELFHKNFTRELHHVHVYPHVCFKLIWKHWQTCYTLSSTKTQRAFLLKIHWKCVEASVVSVFVHSHSAVEFQYIPHWTVVEQRKYEFGEGEIISSTFSEVSRYGQNCTCLLDEGTLFYPLKCLCNTNLPA